MYNSTEHSNTGVAPDTAAGADVDEELREMIAGRLEKRGKFPRKHPTLDVDDHVRVRAKTNPFDKGPSTRFEENQYRIAEKRNTGAGTMYKVLRYRGDGDWHLENRFLMRHELLKVADQQLPELAESVSTMQKKPGSA